MSDTTTTKKRGRPPLPPEEKAKRRAETLRQTEAKKRERRKTELEDKTLAAMQGKQLQRWGEEHVEPGDNSRYLRHALTTFGMPPIDISDENQVEERILWYFNHCGIYDMKPTVNGMCNALGIHRDTLHEWKTGQSRRNSRHQEIVLRAYRVMEELWEDYMLNGKVNPVSGIFLGKNFFNMRDQQEVVLTPNQQRYDEEDLATIEAKYKELPDD